MDVNVVIAAWSVVVTIVLIATSCIISKLLTLVDAMADAMKLMHLHLRALEAKIQEMEKSSQEG